MGNYEKFDLNELILANHAALRNCVCEKYCRDMLLCVLSFSVLMEQCVWDNPDEVFLSDQSDIKQTAMVIFFLDSR